MFLGMFHLPKKKSPKNIFSLSSIPFLRLPQTESLKNVNHSVLIVASIKSLINVFQNVKNISLVGEKIRQWS